MKWNARQSIWLTFVVLVNLALWVIPSNVIEQIARDRQTMLGRYSRQHFAWILAIGLISIVSFYVDWSTGPTYKRRWFQVLAIVLFALPSLVLADFLLRSPERSHYIRDTLAYHHPPNARYAVVFEDKPVAYRTYPDAPAGYPPLPCTLQTDARGFRNPGTLERSDVVVLGDSFAEGSSVSDEHAWPAVLASQTSYSVYNLGMSGYDPLHYLASLREYGLALEPDVVVCLVYEGNDFRSAKGDRKRTRPAFSERFRRYRKQSPLIELIDRMMVDTFGPFRAKAPVPHAELLDWLPLAIPSGPNARRYAFAPKQLGDLYPGRESFAADRHWLNVRGLLREMNRVCLENNVRFTVAYAPTTAHVMLPLAAERLSAEKVRAFVALDNDDPFPDPPTFLRTLLNNLDGRARVVEDWCRDERIEFIDLTEPLRAAALAGTQVYYTYDQHWTPEGHQVVAGAIARILTDGPVPLSAVRR